MAAAVLAVVGVIVIAVAVVSPGSTPAPPQPSAAAVAAPAPPAPPATTAPSVVPLTSGPVLARSQPVRLDVPAIGVSSPLLQLGANPDKTLQTPPLEKDSKASWFDLSPTPGELGPAILLGHVDSKQWGPGVFFRLGALKPGQEIEVTRADRTVATFVVDRVATYPKDAFPSLEVYGNTPNAQLRLITCGGIFDPDTRNYENNIVAYAHLAGTRPA